MKNIQKLRRAVFCSYLCGDEEVRSRGLEGEDRNEETLPNAPGILIQKEHDPASQPRLFATQVSDGEKLGRIESHTVSAPFCLPPTNIPF